MSTSYFFRRLPYVRCTRKYVTWNTGYLRDVPTYFPSSYITHVHWASRPGSVMGRTGGYGRLEGRGITSFARPLSRVLALLHHASRSARRACTQPAAAARVEMASQRAPTTRYTPIPSPIAFSSRTSSRAGKVKGKGPSGYPQLELHTSMYK